jgi:uncharacterized protein YegP (UPF0339 family)
VVEFQVYHTNQAYYTSGIMSPEYHAKYTKLCYPDSGGSFLINRAWSGMAAKFQLYTDKKGEFRWRLAASNGQTIATGGERYKAKDSTKAGIESVKQNAPKAAIEEK